MFWAKVMTFHYADEAGLPTQRVIWPIAISYFDSQRLVIAWCELRKDFRTFRADRMARADVRFEKYQERRKALLKCWIEQEKASGRDVHEAVFM